MGAAPWDCDGEREKAECSDALVSEELEGGSAKGKGKKAAIEAVSERKSKTLHLKACKARKLKKEHPDIPIPTVPLSNPPSSRSPAHGGGTGTGGGGD